MMYFGYLVTMAVLASFLFLLISIAKGRKELEKVISPFTGRYTLLVLSLMVLFFILFSALYVSPVERLYFDESIYQGIALNILHNGNALWCQYGTGYLTYCGFSEVYHDPVGWSFFIGLSFFIFGTGIATSYALQLLVGALTIIGVFLLSGTLFGRRDVALAAAAVMALNPQLFVWSRTQAVIDLPFMMLTLFSFFFFMVALKRKALSTYAMAAFSLVITSYTRIEAFLLIPIFLIIYMTFGDAGIIGAVKSRIRQLRKGFHYGYRLGLLALFVLLIVPELAFIANQAQTGNYGQAQGKQGLLSIGSFEGNIVPNLQFFFGLLTDLYQSFPIVYLPEITVLAIIGFVLFAFDKRYRGRFSVILALGLWILLFHLFYDFFYAGSVLYGVDARFMLEIMPPLAVAAGLGIFEIASLSMRLIPRFIRSKSARKAAAAYVVPAICIALFAVIVAYPFWTISHFLTLPAPELPQETVDLGALNFIYENYNAVPNSCLVFSFTPDVWYALNRSAAQISYLGSQDPGFVNFSSHYSCFVLDYGYWCQIPPFKSSTCSSTLQDYNTTPIVSQGNETGNGVGFYRLNNYNP